MLSSLFRDSENQFPQPIIFFNYIHDLGETTIILIQFLVFLTIVIIYKVKQLEIFLHVLWFKEPFEF